MLIKTPVFAVLIVSGGTGSRCGSDIPKQYCNLMGRPVLQWALDAFAGIAAGPKVIVVGDEHQTHMDGIDLHGATVATGGRTRQESVRQGLEALALMTPVPDYVLVHDAARPCVTPVLIEKLCNDVLRHGAAVPALPITDSIKRLNPQSGLEPVSRDNLYTVQTPQAFAFDKLLAAHRMAKGNDATDDAALFEAAGYDVHLTPGDADNIKVTYPGDFQRAAAILSSVRGDIRTGKGYDVHRLAPAPMDGSRRLMIGGIAIPHDKVLEGHSDADVLLHAMTDALLATICDGDIGMHFSPSDMRWKNADSAAFLRHAATLIRAQDGMITHIDSTVVCEAPRIGPHRDRLRNRIAEILSLPVDRVSVKATTSEGLGFTGRGEGIAAEAVATVRLPFIRRANAVQTETQQREAS